jgi:hypothetical protein
MEIGPPSRAESLFENTMSNGVDSVVDAESGTQPRARCARDPELGFVTPRASPR